MVLVESSEIFETVLEKFKTSETLIIPILLDTKTHPAVNPVCVLSISTPVETFILPFDHNEGRNLDKSLLSCLMTSQTVWAPSKKNLLHILPHLVTIKDASSLEYLNSGVLSNRNEQTLCAKYMSDKFSRQLRLNKSIPLMKHIEYCEIEAKYWWSIIEKHRSLLDGQDFKFLNDIAIPALQFLESTGNHVDPILCEQKFGSKICRFISNEFVYNEYNLYTSTGRCSNKFGGINFAALSKKDETRSMFTSRFENGVMVLADFESFHLRLIADMMGYDLPVGIPMHEFLGRQYFNKDILTEEEYNEGKQITFRLLYSEDRDINVPDFFKSVYQYVDMLMVLLDRQKYILSPYYKRKIKQDNIENPTPSKVFNYMIQLAETEMNLTAINKLKSEFNGKLSCPTLYTYDSLLFDYNPLDGKELLLKSIEILSQNGKFPMRIYYGVNYQNLKRLDI